MKQNQEKKDQEEITNFFLNLQNRHSFYYDGFFMGEN